MTKHALKTIPNHVAIIMDGNGRWANVRGLPRSMGHRKGVEAVREAVRTAAEMGVGYLTLFAFSSENWSRPESEVSDLMGLLKAFIRRDLQTLHKENVRIRVIGDRSNLRSDILPLLLLFAVSVTGLMLTASYTWMRGYAYDFLAILHAATVIVTLLWLPFGKLFHVFQRPAQLGVGFYKDGGARDEQTACRRCREPFASAPMVRDLTIVERELGFRYELPDGGHYQNVCPRCRRALFGLAQGSLWREYLNQTREAG